MNPGAVAWFKASATPLTERLAPYLALLDRHGIECVKRTSPSPGRIVYEDDVQVIVVPQ